MTLAFGRKVAALLLALFVAGGSLAGAGGAKDYGESTPGPVHLDGGAKDYGE
ncbi:hypothetical protein [Deinococcus terrestris]|uniref:hypothetical protein n=1 Tax=Deinococcus terrestris TaxID=2651870 RepID=UPI001883DB82|nr:hypothetical protein [Deinococcus terrestris]